MMMKKFSEIGFVLGLFIFLLQASSLPAQTQNLFINEILASNTKSNLSPDYSEYADWIELCNTGSTDIDISNFYLTDDLSTPQKWQIPTGIFIPANGYILFWTDNRNSGIHTNFKLSKGGEAVGLYDSGGTVIDTISFGKQVDDISYGRLADNILEWNFLSIPTPLAKNNSGVIELSPAPHFSLPGGFYNGSQTITITTESSSAEIRYTLDGIVPDEMSALFSVPILIDSTTAVRAKSFKAGSKPGEVVTNTYFINEEINLPVISLVTDPDNLFSDETGIYVTGTNGKTGDCDPTIRNVNQDWERPVNIEFYETSGELRINQEAGIKIFGGCSRTRYPQKSFALYARSAYGKGSFNYQLFPDKPIKKFESFLLRSSADDQVFTMFRDGLAHNVVGQTPNADIQAYRPAVVFINGSYWGIHNIREKVNEHYFAGNFNLDHEDVNILERDPYYSYNVVYGSASTYNAMMDYIKSRDMRNDTYYGYVQTQMDVDQYIDYQIGHIYLAERDWPGNNIRFWRADSGQFTKWRWINYDMDQTFIHTTENKLAVATYPNGFGWPNPQWSTLLLRNLLKNNNFKNQFIQRFLYLVSTLYEPQSLIRIIDSLQSKIKHEIPRHIKKWGGKLDPDFHENWTIKPTISSVEEWETYVDSMRIFSVERPDYAIQYLADYFNLGNALNLTVNSNVAEAGRLNINGWKIPNTIYTCKYFKNIPLTVEAIPVLGYRFSYWQIGVSKFTDRKLELTLANNTVLTAYYEKETGNSGTVVINEINYNSSNLFNTGDWIEIYNSNDQKLDLSDWYLKDESDEHKFIFPDGTEIDSLGYLVITSDRLKFNKLVPQINSCIGDFDFGLSNAGELIRLYTNNNFLIDSVRYENKYPWPADADGSGATLELKDPSLDNSVVENWIAVAGKHGTPGIKNSTVTGISANDQTVPKHFELYQNYPNPFNPVTTINYSIPSVETTPPNDRASRRVVSITLKVYDILGRVIATLVDEEKSPGNYEVEFKGNNLPSGIYFYTLKAGNFIQTNKMVLLK